MVGRAAPAQLLCLVSVYLVGGHSYRHSRNGWGRQLDMERVKALAMAPIAFGNRPAIAAPKLPPATISQPAKGAILERQAFHFTHRLENCRALQIYDWGVDIPGSPERADVWASPIHSQLT